LPSAVLKTPSFTQGISKLKTDIRSKGKDLPLNISQQQQSKSKQSESRNDNQSFIQLFSEMNEKAMACINKEEPETALEYLKKVNETLIKLEKGSSTNKVV
jgi:hypothetical protein